MSLKCSQTLFMSAWMDEWKENFEDLMNYENAIKHRIEEADVVEQEVVNIGKD